MVDIWESWYCQTTFFLHFWRIFWKIFFFFKKFIEKFFLKEEKKKTKQVFKIANSVLHKNAKRTTFMKFNPLNGIKVILKSIYTEQFKKIF